MDTYSRKDHSDNRIVLIFLGQSAFSERLGPLNPPIDVFGMLVNDKMHEWDAGSVKRLLSFLVRLLNSVDGQLVEFLDEW